MDLKGRGFSLDRRDIGLEVDRVGVAGEGSGTPGSPGPRTKLPAGHKFFPDCERETLARMIEYSVTRSGEASWFVTLTFPGFLSEARAYGLLTTWLCRLQEAYKVLTGVRGLRWFVAQEWQKRGVIHFHLVLSGARLDSLSRMRWENRWQGISGGFARIYPARVKSAPYLAWYASKAQGGAVKQGGTWRGITFPKSTSCCRT